jgi:hypothetical protein
MRSEVRGKGSGSSRKTSDLLPLTSYLDKSDKDAEDVSGAE